jgi:hypothetical protein
MFVAGLVYMGELVSKVTKTAIDPHARQNPTLSGIRKF